MATKSEFTHKQQYDYLLNETFNLVEYSHLKQIPNLSWFENYFGQNGEAFKISHRMSNYLLLSIVVGICVTLPPLMYGAVGWPKDGNHGHMTASAIMGVSAAIIIGSLLVGILSTFLVSRLFWMSYRKQYIDLKKFVINLFDSNLIDFSGFSQEILILTNTERIWPPYVIRATNISVDQLVNEYAKMGGQDHNQKLHNLIRTISDVSILNKMGFFLPRGKYKFAEIFFFCGAIYCNCCSQIEKLGKKNS